MFQFVWSAKTTEFYHHLDAIKAQAYQVIR